MAGIAYMGVHKNMYNLTKYNSIKMTNVEQK